MPPSLTRPLDPLLKFAWVGVKFSIEFLQISSSFQKMCKTKKPWYLSPWECKLKYKYSNLDFCVKSLKLSFSFLFSFFRNFNIFFFPSFSERLCWTLKPVLYTTVSFPVCLDCLSQCVYLPVFISLRVYFTCYILTFHSNLFSVKLLSQFTQLGFHRSWEPWWLPPQISSLCV